MHNDKLFVSTLVNLRLHVAVSTFHTLLRKANFNPSQPRVPAGEVGGGRWTDSADFDSVQPNSPLGTLLLFGAKAPQSGNSQANILIAKSRTSDATLNQETLQQEKLLNSCR